MPHTLLDHMACEAGRAAARVFKDRTGVEPPLYAKMNLVHACGDALSAMDTERAQLCPPIRLLETFEGDQPPAAIVVSRDFLEGIIKEFEGAIPIDQEAADTLLAQAHHLLKS